VATAVFTGLKGEEMADEKVPPITSVVRALDVAFGERDIAEMAGAASKDDASRWMRGERMNVEQEAKLRTGHKAFEIISKADGWNVARAWMLGMNPQLDDENPILCIAQGRCRDVLMAAQAHVNGDVFG